MRSPSTTTKTSPYPPQLEKAHAQQQRPSTAKKKKKVIIIHYNNIQTEMTSEPIK